ncbi:MAG: cation:proton antiporter [Acidobacteriota bacterium]
MTDSALASLLFLQLACILLVCRGLGWIASRVRQPQVIAEMVAGFLLGPSFLGWLAPGVQGRLFPADARPVLFVTSQIGLILYMFCVGLEFRVDLVSRYRRRALTVSAAGIAVPFVLGAALALLMLERGGLFTDHVTAIQAALFLGAAMSITAFPVLARIISERGIAGTTVGSLALTAGAVDDAAAWVILACALSSFNANTTLALAAAGGAAAYAGIVFLAVRPFLVRMAADAERRDGVSLPMFGTILALVALGAWFADAVGIYSVFGAFLLGSSVPRGVLSRELRRLIEPLTTSMLVPLFFVYSGLNTQLTLVNSAGLLWMTGLVFAIACAGKGLACWGAARIAGATSRESLAVATLMNARGMVELILINIGFQRGLITPTLFTILVLMALGTTLMTGPLFSLVWERESESLRIPTGEEQPASNR